MLANYGAETPVSGQMRIRLCVRALFPLQLLLAASTLWGQDDTAVLYTAERMILGNGESIEAAALAVNNGVIEAVGAAREFDESNYSLVDLGSTTIVPAFIDGHTHLGYEAYDSWGGENYSEANLLDNLRRYTWYGFAAVFSAGSDPHAMALALQSRQGQEPRLGGASMRSARLLFGAGMAPSGAGPNNQFLSHVAAIEQATGMTILSGVNSAEEGRVAVAQIAEKGIKFIKIWVDDRGGSQPKLSEEVYSAIMQEARARGIQVFVHQQTADDMPALIAAGANGFLHGRIGDALDADIAKALSAAGAFLVPNLGLGELRREDISQDSFLAATLHQDVLNRLHDNFQPPGGGGSSDEELRAGLQRLLAEDVEIVLGTDAGALPNHFFGYTGHRELEIYTRLGMTEMEALVAATGNAARNLGLEDLGELVPGKRASFIVLEQNPLEDIRNTRSILDVYIDGVRQQRQALANEWTTSVSAPAGDASIATK